MAVPVALRLSLSLSHNRVSDQKDPVTVFIMVWAMAFHHSLIFHLTQRHSPTAPCENESQRDPTSPKEVDACTRQQRIFFGQCSW